MDFFITILCFLLTAAVGIWVGRLTKTDKTETQGKLVIVRDQTDGETYTAIYMSQSLMDSLKTDDHIQLEIEVRQ